MRQQPFLQADDEHHRVLQALGLMQGDTRHRVALLLQRIDIRDQRHLFEEGWELGLARQIDIIGRHIAQLQHVVPAIGPLFLAVLAQQRLLEPDPTEQEIHQLAQVSGFARGDHIIYDLEESKQRVPGAGGERARATRTGVQRLTCRPLAFDLRLVGQDLQRHIDRHPHGGGPAVQLVLGALADAPRGPIKHPREADAIVGVQRQPQIGQRILDLFALVEARAADDLVAQAARDQRFLERTRLGVGAIHDRHIAGPIHAARNQPRDLVGHQLGLLVLVVPLLQADQHALVVLRPELLEVLTLRAALDHRLGHIEDRLGAAIILLEQDDLRIGVVVFERADVADVGAAESVHRLILVAHHKDIAVPGG